MTRQLKQAKTTRDCKGLARRRGRFRHVFSRGPHLLKPRFWLFNKPRIKAFFAVAVTERVTVSYYESVIYLYCLNYDTGTCYDFNVFVPASAPTYTNNLAQEEVNKLILGTRLQKGDLITKAANRTTLPVRRGDSTTQWYCSPDSLVSE